MAKKYYAIVKGKKTGIFDNWNIAKEYINGYKGAIYKSFLTIEEANKYLNESNLSDEVKNQDDINKILKKDSEEGIYSFFVDGSYNKFTKKIGYGVVCYKDEIIHTFYKALTDKEMALYKSSLNVAGEIFGTLYSIKYALEQKFTKIKIYFDYEGIEKWATKSWDAKSDIAVFYVNKIQDIKDKIQIKFQKVRAHVNIEFNEIADQLAKKSVS